MIDQKLLYDIVRTRLRARRIEIHLTQEALSLKTNVSRSTIANVELGHQNLPLHVIFEICHGLETEPMRVLPSVAEVTCTVDPVHTLADDPSSMASSLPMTAEFIHGVLEQAVQAHR